MPYDLSTIPTVTGVAALDLAIQLIAKEGHTPEVVYESMCEAIDDVKSKSGVAFEQHLFAMGYVLSLMHVRQAFAPRLDESIN